MGAMVNRPLISKSQVFNDDRGVFFPLDISDKKWVQSNISISSKWTFRGLHHQLHENAQTKLVTVIKGSILDVIIDLRYGSFEHVLFFKLIAGDQLYVPKGFAHGFLSLEDDTIIQYLVDNKYTPEFEVSFDWKSNETIKELILAEIGDETNIKMSAKDTASIPIGVSNVETIDYSII